MQEISPSEPSSDQSTDQSSDSQKILVENNALLKAIYQSTEKTRKYIVFGKILNLVYLLLILVPLIWGYIVLAPRLNLVLSTYKDLLGL